MMNICIKNVNHSFLLCSLAIIFTGCADIESIDEFTTSTDKIIGGRLSKDHHSVVGLVFNGSILCTGALITKRSILTAAHCLVEKKRGRTIINEPNQVIFTQGKKRKKRIEVIGSVIHPDYDDHNLINDLAILYLAEEAQQEPLKLFLDDPSLLTDREVTIVGFGQNKRGKSGVKRRAIMKVISYDHDFVHVKSPNKRHRISCFGDSGGPVLVEDQNEEYIAGVLSFGSKGCGKKSIDFYGRVDTQETWILNHQNP
jgi:secreted trypsin-like serine protease